MTLWLFPKIIRFAGNITTFVEAEDYAFFLKSTSRSLLRSERLYQASSAQYLPQRYQTNPRLDTGMLLNRFIDLAGHSYYLPLLRPPQSARTVVNINTEIRGRGRKSIFFLISCCGGLWHLEHKKFFLAMFILSMIPLVTQIGSGQRLQPLFLH